MVKKEDHRQTFYNHFDNILDLFKTLFYEDLARAVGPNKTLGTWQKGFLATLNYLRNNAAMIINVLHSSYWPEIRAYCGTLSSRLLDRVIGECMEDLGVQLEENDRRFIVNFYRRAFNGLIIDWAREGMKEEPELVLKKLLIMIRGGITRAITAFHEEKNK